MANITTFAPTATPTASPPPFSLLYVFWDESNGQQMTYDYKINCANAVAVAFVTVLTQYMVSQWIIDGYYSSSKATDDHRSVPVYLVSGVTCVLIWSFLLNSWAGNYDPLPIGYHIATPLLGTVGGVMLNLIFYFIWDRAFNVEQEKNNNSEDETQEVVATTTAVATAEGGTIQELEQGRQEQVSPPATTKLHFINNIKVFLTGLVMVYHVADLYLGYVYNLYVLNNWGGIIVTFFQEWPGAWFMHLFFFYSGYFSPKSLDKKGRYQFLFERIKRLGIPLIVLGYLIYPFSNGGGYLFPNSYLFANQSNFGIFAPGVAWFTMHLIFFNVAYAFICGVGWNPKIRCPSLLVLFGISTLLSLIAGITSWFFPSGSGDFVMGVPMFWIIYLGYIVFFLGGALAARNNWIESIKAKSRLAIYLWALLALIVYGLNYWWKIVLSQNPDASGLSYTTRLLFEFVWSFVYIQQAIPVGLAITVFFADFVNGKCPEFFSKSMYTAYLIQLTLPIPAALKCWQLILDSSGFNVGTEEPTGGIFLAGFLFSIILSQIFNWPLAYAIRSIPGFSKVL